MAPRGRWELAGTGGADEAKRLSRDAFAAEYEACARALWCVAVGVIGTRDQADDVLQDAVVTAIQRLDQFEVGTNFIAWMARIVRFTALNFVRRRARAGGGPVEPATIDILVASRPPAPADPISSRGDLALDQSQFDDDLRASLLSLEPDCRACLLLRTVMDMPYKEIARALDMPEGTAMSHVHRARKQLRDRLFHVNHVNQVSPAPAGGEAS